MALAHDYLAVQGGAERVVVSLIKAFPGVPVYTSVYRPEMLFQELAEPALDVRPTPLNRVGLLRNHYRATLPFLPWAMSRTNIDADVVVCSSSGWAHGVSTTGHKVVYCHNPARWLYQRDVYLSLRRPAWWFAATAMRSYLKGWDQRQALSCDRYLANSTVVARRIRDAYGIEAEVLSPPSSLDPDGPRRELPMEPGFALCVGRLLGYKHVDAIVEAFRHEPARRLVVVGDGPDRASLERDLPPNVQLLGRLPDESLRWLYANAAFLIAASEEDFGLTPVEAMMFGTPSIVLRYGGFLDSMIEGTTAVYFDAPAPAAIRAALGTFDSMQFDRAAIQARGAQFSEARFRERLHDVVREVAGFPAGPTVVDLDALERQAMTASAVGQPSIDVGVRPSN